MLTMKTYEKEKSRNLTGLIMKIKRFSDLGWHIAVCLERLYDLRKMDVELNKDNKKNQKILVKWNFQQHNSIV